MTPRIPMGWTRTTERGEGVWMDVLSGGWKRALPFGPLAPRRTYIVRTDPSVPADPNECLRLEDEAASIDEREPDHAPDAEPMVPGMMRTADDEYVPLHAVHCINARGAHGKDGETIASGDCKAAYTAAWVYAERRRAEIAEEVRRAHEVVEVRLADEPPAPDLGEWPGKPDVPPDRSRDVEILTPHGVCVGDAVGADWRARIELGGYEYIDPRGVLRWRELPHAIVVDGRVTGVTRG